MNRSTFFRYSLVVALLVVFAACGGGNGDGTGGEAETTTPETGTTTPDTSEQAAASQEMLEEGQAIFTGQGICYTCHGQDATGTQLAPDLTDDEWINIPEPITQGKIVTLVKSGVADPVEYPAPMPPMGGAQLSDEQLQAVSAYVNQLSQ